MSFELKIDRKLSVPLHEQLYEELRRNIIQLQPGTRLPSENALCRKYSLSRLTIARALNALTEKGYIRRVRGSGSFVDNPHPRHIYYLLPCVDAIKNPGKFQTMHVYAGALSRAAQYNCRIETLLAAPCNIAWELDRNVIKNIPPQSDLVVFGSWLRDIFSTIRECRHNVAYVNLQAEKGPETRENIIDWHHITIDRKVITDQIIRALTAAGCRRIALIHNYNHYLNPHYAAYRESLVKSGCSYTPELVIYTLDDDLAAQYAVRHLLDFSEEFPFDAVLTSTNSIAQGVVKQLRRNNFQLPEDVPVISLNHTVMPPEPDFAQLELPLQRAGELAVEYFCNHRTEQSVLYGHITVPQNKSWDFLHIQPEEKL